MDDDEIITAQKKKNDRHDSLYLWPKLIIEDTQWFNF